MWRKANRDGVFGPSLCRYSAIFEFRRDCCCLWSRALSPGRQDTISINPGQGFSLQFFRLGLSPGKRRTLSHIMSSLNSVSHVQAAKSTALLMWPCFHIPTQVSDWGIYHHRLIGWGRFQPTGVTNEGIMERLRGGSCWSCESSLKAGLFQMRCPEGFQGGKIMKDRECLAWTEVCVCVCV